MGVCWWERVRSSSDPCYISGSRFDPSLLERLFRGIQGPTADCRAQLSGSLRRSSVGFDGVFPAMTSSVALPSKQHLTPQETSFPTAAAPDPSHWMWSKTKLWLG